MPRHLQPPPPDTFWYVAAERYVDLLAQLREATRALNPAPDSLVGMKRSGLFLAVYLSHQLNLPMFTSGELDSFPTGRLKRPLLVDTMAWSGGALRAALAQFERLGISEARALVLFARQPPPEVPHFSYLATCERIVHFWYEYASNSASETS